MGKVKILKKATGTKKALNLRFNIDCSQPVDDKVIACSDFQDFLTKRIKVEGKTGNLGENVTLSNDGSKVTVSSDVPFSKRYLKYLTKKYLKKQQLRDFLLVVASDKNTYQLRYMNIQQDEEEQE